VTVGLVDPETREAMERVEQGLRGEIQASAAETHRRIDEVATASERRDAELREEIQASAAETHRRIVEVAAASERRDTELREEIQAVHRRIAESEHRLRRHFDVAVEAFRDETRTLAEGIMTVAEASLRRDTELADRSDRLDQRVLGLEARVSLLEQRPPRRRRRR
jgi:hypothetical protein